MVAEFLGKFAWEVETLPIQEFYSWVTRINSEKREKEYLNRRK